MKCTAHTRAGNECKAQAIKGATVCRVHGGMAPQVRNAARARLLEALDPAAGELVRIALNAKNEQVRVSAIKELFERAGFGEPKTSRHHHHRRLLDAEIARLTAELAENDLHAE